MRCNSLEECRSEIRAYCNHEPIGYSLLVDVENYDHFQELLLDFKADASKTVIFMSDLCRAAGLPDVQNAYDKMFSAGSYAVIGISQACMLHGRDELQEEIDRLCEHSATGHTIILLEHCREYLEEKLRSDPRLKNRIVLLEGPISPLPKILISRQMEVLENDKVQGNIKELLSYLEQLTDNAVNQQEEIYVSTGFSVYTFKKADYSIHASPSAYEKLCKKYPEIAENTNENNGTDNEWIWLLEQIGQQTSFHVFLDSQFGAHTHLDNWLSNWEVTRDERILWLYWLAMRIYPPSNPYLTFAVQQAKSSKDLEEAIYLALCKKAHTDKDYQELYQARRKILQNIPENLKLTLKYCNEIEQHDDAAIYYLTDLTEPERIKLLKCLERNQYSEVQLKTILETVSPSLAMYLQPYEFTPLNTRLPKDDDTFLDILTQYFNKYKFQKITNHILPEFMDQVESFAKERPYTKLSSRMSILKHLECQETQAYFLDAFGVEYLSYFLNRCNEYDLLAEVHIGRAELPTITSMNKDFESYFIKRVRKIEKLDEIKHYSNIYDYQKCKEPLHLFAELDLIDDVLKKIAFGLDELDKAVIVSDHGASRLAVIHESEASIRLEEKGQHSGRCCQVDVDPKLTFAAYEQGYAVLANYDRFRGGRKANVEVHGGASLEEVLVPIILLSAKPKNKTFRFVQQVIDFKPGQVVKLTLFCNVSMKNPRLHVNGVYYDGVFITNHQHAEFTLNNIRRKGIYYAEVYEGGAKCGVTLTFEIRKRTHEVDFGF